MLSNALSHKVGVRFLAALATLSVAGGAARAALPGFTEDFVADNGSFFSGASPTHIPSGGVGGAGDGYLLVAHEAPGNLGAATAGAEFTGDLTADGVTGFSLWLNDVGNDQALQMHVGLGNSFGNFWLYQPAFLPPENAWGLFTVDFSNPADWVQTRGSGTFQQALQISDRLLLRHDLAPFGPNPDAIAGDLGIDRVTVLPEPTSVALLLAGGLFAARRRR